MQYFNNIVITHDKHLELGSPSPRPSFPLFLPSLPLCRPPLSSLSSLLLRPILCLFPLPHSLIFFSLLIICPTVPELFSMFSNFHGSNHFLITVRSVLQSIVQQYINQLESTKSSLFWLLTYSASQLHSSVRLMTLLHLSLLLIPKYLKLQRDISSPSDPSLDWQSIKTKKEEACTGMHASCMHHACIMHPLQRHWFLDLTVI